MEAPLTASVQTVKRRAPPLGNLVHQTPRNANTSMVSQQRRNKPSNTSSAHTPGNAHARAEPSMVRSPPSRPNGSTTRCVVSGQARRHPGSSVMWRALDACMANDPSDTDILSNKRVIPPACSQRTSAPPLQHHPLLPPLAPPAARPHGRPSGSCPGLAVRSPRWLQHAHARSRRRRCRARCQRCCLARPGVRLRSQTQHSMSFMVGAPTLCEEEGTAVPGYCTFSGVGH